MRRKAWKISPAPLPEPEPAAALLPELVIPAPIPAENVSSSSSHSLAPLEHFAPIELAVFEVSGFPAALLPELPSPWLLLAETLPAVHGPAERIRFAFASSADFYRSARALGLPTFNASEWATFALAAELERVSYPTTARWLARKAAEPDLLFTPERCIGVEPTQPDRRSLSVGQVMACIGCRLIKAECA